MLRKTNVIFNATLAILLSILMTIQPVFEAIADEQIISVTRAVNEEQTGLEQCAVSVNQTISENDSTSENQFVSDNQVISDNQIAPETPIISDNQIVIEQPVVSDNQVDNDSSAISDNQTSAVSDNIVDSDIEDEFSMPSDYRLSSKQMDEKKTLKQHLGEVNSAAEGADYQESEVYFLADTKEEALQVAEGYHATLKEYSYGVATLALGSETSVTETVALAADTTNNLPAVWPNYISYLETREVISTHDTDTNDSFATNVENAYSAEQSLLNGDGSATAANYNSVMAAASEPYLQFNSPKYQWHHVAVGSTYAWNELYTGNGVKVAIIDSGVTPMPSPYTKELELAFNYSVSSNTATDDQYGHGTHIAGIIGARSNDYFGCGVAPTVSLYNIRVLDKAGRGTDDDICRGIRCAVSQRVDIINLSFSGKGYTQTMQKVITEAYEEGITVIAAAGNDGHSNRSYPASLDHVISVAATDKNNERCSFSNYGPTVDFAAPGKGIWSVEKGLNDYCCLEGTDMAAAIVSGEAAILLHANPQIARLGQNSKRVDALEQIMKANAISAGTGMGRGIINLPKALKISVADAKPSAPVIKTVLSKEKQWAQVIISVSGNHAIYYSTDGKTPSCTNGMLKNATKYTSSITLDKAKTYAIMAIAVNKSGVAGPVKSAKVTLNPYVSSIEIRGTRNLSPGKSTQLTAIVLPTYAANKKVTWSISPEGQGVTINQKGKVSVKKTAKPGNYSVIVKAKDAGAATSERKAPFTIKVIETAKVKIKKLSVSKNSLNATKVYSGKDNVSDPVSTADAFANIKYTAVTDKTRVLATDFTWSSSNESIAVVNEKGIVTLKKGGTVKITAAATDGSGLQASFKYKISANVSYIKIGGDELLAPGSSIKLTGTVNSDATDKNIIWQVRPETSGGGVTVKNGIVNAAKDAVPGRYTITAKPKDGTVLTPTPSKEIIVCEEAVSKISFASKKETIFRVAGSYAAPTTKTITATFVGGLDNRSVMVRNTNPNLVACEYSTSFARVAGKTTGTVTITVKAIGAVTGTADIIVESLDGTNKKAKCKVTVINPVSRVNIAASVGASNIIAQGRSLQLKAPVTTEYGKVSTKAVTWSVSPGEGLKINSKGKVTTTSQTQTKSYVVTATAKDGSNATDKYTIQVKHPIRDIRLSGTGDWKKKNVNYTVEKIPGKYTLSLTVDSDNYSEWKYMTVTSSNDAICNPCIDGGEVDLQVYKPGTVKLKLKVLDGSNKTVTYKLKITQKK